MVPPKTTVQNAAKQPIWRAQKQSGALHSVQSGGGGLIWSHPRRASAPCGSPPLAPGEQNSEASAFSEASGSTWRDSDSGVARGAGRSVETDSGEA